MEKVKNTEDILNKNNIVKWEEFTIKDLRKLAMNLFEPILKSRHSSGGGAKILFYLLVLYYFLFKVILVVMNLQMFDLPQLYLVFIVADQWVSWGWLQKYKNHLKKKKKNLFFLTFLWPVFIN